MGKSDLSSFLRARLANVEERIQRACSKANRRRNDIRLVGVTKSVTPEIAAALHALGVRDLGESRPQELWRKQAALPDTVRWHLIGHLQTNKIEKTIPMAPLIHSVDRPKLLTHLEKEAAKRSLKLSVLLEVNASREPQKHGIAPEDLPSVLELIPALQHIQVRGLMCMAAYSPNPEDSRPAFGLLRELRDRFHQHLAPPHNLQHLSMGMTNDFEVAITEGATMIRLGSVLFEGIDKLVP